MQVGVLGATGAVGQRFIQLLEHHPWFEVSHVYASERSAGKKYSDAVTWKMDTPIPAAVASLEVRSCTADSTTPLLVFSALDSEVATEVEQAFASYGCAVVSNSKNYRMHNDVPLVIPEVNPDHLKMVQQQPYKGFIVTNPNCSTVGLCMALAPLHQAYGIENVSVVTMQAASGAGYPGVSSMDLIDNVVPFIGSEEDKVITEPKKILGTIDNNTFKDAAITIDATCNRVPVRDGHTECVSLSFAKKPRDISEVIETLNNFQGVPQELGLPSAPEHPVVYCAEENRPQPILDRQLGNGMTVSVGRLRPANVFDYSFTLLVHNTIRGAAGAAILNAELLYRQGYLDSLEK